MSGKQVELYIGYTNHTWSTVIVEIPSDIEIEHGLLETAYLQEVEKLTEANLQHLIRSDIAFIGMYNENPFREEE